MIITNRHLKKVLLCTAAALLLPCGAPAAWSPADTGMFDLYAANRDEAVGNCITVDFVLLGHQMILSENLAALEEGVLAGELAAFATDVAAALPADSWNRRWFTLLAALCSGERSVSLSDSVEAELRLIDGAKEIALSPLMGCLIDYSRFKPRGRYTRSAAMERWFRAMTWAGSARFSLVASAATGVSGETARQRSENAFELALLLEENRALAAKYQRIDTLLTQLFGPAEDPTWRECLEYDDAAQLRRQLPSDRRRAGKQSRIQDGIVRLNLLKEGQSAAQVLTGIYLFPRRFTADAAAMQQLVAPVVGDWEGGAELPLSAEKAGERIYKAFPLASELLSLLGSSHAEREVVESGNSQWHNYPAARNAALQQLRAPGNLAVNTALMRSWLSGTGLSKEQAARRTNAMHGYWIAGRWLSLLFTKQSVTGLMKGLESSSARRSAWLEPAQLLYLQLAAGTRRWRDAVAEMEGGESLVDSLNSWLQMLDRLAAIAGEERAGVPLSRESIAWLNSFDRRLLALTGRKDRPLVVDVHTDAASGQVLEEALGHAVRLTHTTPEGETVGALFSCYEFKQPLSDRLDDRQWAQKLAAGFEKKGRAIPQKRGRDHE